jgi:DNA-binding response OmpR family regulator
VRLLVVEDEVRLAAALKRGLQAEGFTVDVAHDGVSGLHRAREGAHDGGYAAIVLDIMLPGLSGYRVCERLRAEGNWVPVLMLSAKDGEYDEADGLDVGADDYLTKPFSPRELVARIKAVLRRTDRPVEAADLIRVGDLQLDVPRMRTEVAGRSVDLTPTEFTLLATLARQPGRIFTRSQLLDALHGIAFESYERAIDSHIKNLRRKLEPDPRQPRYVLTVYGVGYRLADDR